MIMVLEIRTHFLIYITRTKIQYNKKLLIKPLPLPEKLLSVFNVIKAVFYIYNPIPIAYTYSQTHKRIQKNLTKGYCAVAEVKVPVEATIATDHSSALFVPLYYQEPWHLTDEAAIEAPLHH